MAKISKKRQEMGEDAWALYQKQRKLAKAQKWQNKNLEKYVFYKREQKRKLVEYKGGECEKCGYNKKYPTVYHFHHNDPSQKEYTLASKSFCFETAKREVDKCRLLCSNCHGEIHDEEYLASKHATIKRMRNETEIT